MGGGCNDAQPGKAPLSAAEVGGSFVLQYYRTLTTDRDNLHKYYKDESICSRGMEGAGPDQITYAAGVEEIREEIQNTGFAAASRTEINCIQSQESKQGGIVVLVLGYFEYSDSTQKVHFTQVFFLDKQTEPYPGYFVLNDILRYVSGKPEQSEVQAQPQTDLPPPLGPPPQPPMLSAPKGAAAVLAEPYVAVEEPVKEAPVQEPVEEEDEYREMDDGGDEEEECEPIPDDTAAEDAVVAEVLAAAEAAEAGSPILIPEEKPSPPSWASMAGKLKEGGGQLGNAKLQGFALPAPAKAKAGVSLPAAKFNAASSTVPVLPPPSAAAKAKAKAAVAAAAAGASDDAVEARLWLSRIPENVENQELLDCLNKLVGDAGMEGNVEVDRKDASKEWGYVNVPSQDVADLLVQNSKDRKVQVRGKALKIDAERKQNFSSNNRRGKGAADEGGEKVADGNRGPRRGKGAKGGGEAGGKGGKGAADARRGGEKGSGGGWRPQA